MVERMGVNGCTFTEKVSATIVSDILSALRCLHSMYITHRDLKPENLMFLSDDPDDPKYNHIKAR